MKARYVSLVLWTADWHVVVIVWHTTRRLRHFIDLLAPILSYLMMQAFIWFDDVTWVMCSINDDLYTLEPITMVGYHFSHSNWPCLYFQLHVSQCKNSINCCVKYFLWVSYDMIGQSRKLRRYDHCSYCHHHYWSPVFSHCYDQRFANLIQYSGGVCPWPHQENHFPHCGLWEPWTHPLNKTSSTLETSLE